MQQWVITAVGADRPGLVEALSEPLSQAGINIADCRMVNLQGQFAIILLAQIANEPTAALESTLQTTCQSLGLQVQMVAPASISETQPTTAQGRPYRLRTYAMDQPGIVHRITQLLSKHHINIEDLQTRLEAGAYTGTPLFTMNLSMMVPANVPIKTLRAQLDTLCDQMNCDLELTPGA